MVDQRTRIAKILLAFGVIPTGCLGAVLILGGCGLGTAWVIALARGASAA